MLPNEFGFGHSVIWLGLGREKALESRNEIDTRPVLVYARQTKPTEPQVKTENFKRGGSELCRIALPVVTVIHFLRHSVMSPSINRVVLNILTPI